MDESAIERARERIRQRADTVAMDALLDRTRESLESLVSAAEEATAGMSDRIDEAVRAGLRDQVTPVARNLAEIRGLSNRLVRRLEQLERDNEAERHARVDDLALLVDLITTGWQSADARLGRIESAVTRLEQGIEERDGAIVYRIEDRR
jgi:predicted NACHT family NTPase